MTDPLKKAAAVADRLPAEGTVVVGCKHPPGLIMQTFTMGVEYENVLGGGKREMPKARPDGKQIKIHGPATPVGQAPRAPIVAGFALTRGIPADFAKKWMEQNGASDVVLNGLFFVAPDMETARSMARERGAEKSGLEQLNTETMSQNGKQVPADARWPARSGVTAKNLSAVETEAEIEPA